MFSAYRYRWFKHILWKETWVILYQSVLNKLDIYFIIKCFNKNLNKYYTSCSICTVVIVSFLNCVTCLKNWMPVFEFTHYRLSPIHIEACNFKGSAVYCWDSNDAIRQKISALRGALCVWCLVGRGSWPLEEKPTEVSVWDLDGPSGSGKAFWVKGKGRSGERECSSSAVDEVQWHNGKILVFGAQ